MLQSADVVSSVSAFCTKQEGFSLRMLWQKEIPLSNIVDSCLRLVDAKSPLERWSIVRAFNKEFSKKTADLEKVKALKKGLCEASKTSNWKGALLGALSDSVVDVRHLYLQYSNAWDLPLKTEERVKFFPGLRIQAACGSTFATNIQKCLNEKGNYLLDAVYGCVCMDQGFFNGYALAVGDGAGGHLGDDQQDIMIARAAHFAVKGGVRFLSAYHQPDKLANDLVLIIDALKHEVLSKSRGEDTTVACCRAFPVEDGFRIVGFNIGDNMVVAWDPATKRSYNLLPSRCSKAGTALFPSSFRAFEVEIVDTIIPDGCLLYLMTDGAHDTLPHIEEENVYPNELGYTVRTLDRLNDILGDIPANSNPELFLQMMVREAYDGAERLRQQGQANANTRIGDDLSLIQCHLKKH